MVLQYKLYIKMEKNNEKNNENKCCYMEDIFDFEEDV